MMNTTHSSTGQLARYFVAGPLVLAVALGFAAARAQDVVPTVVAGKQMDATSSNIPFTTSAVDPATHPLPDGIKAYIASTYPGSSIGGFFVSEKPSEKAPYVKYYASVTERSGVSHKLYFNADAQPVKVVPRELRPTGHLTVLSRVYVDGQVYTGTLDDIGAKNIASINVYKDAEARRLFGAVADTGDGVVVVTTLANQDQPAVRAFNEKLGIAPTGPPAPAASTPYLAAPALAYITKNYPDARLMEVAEVKSTDGSPSRYRALIATGRRPTCLLFDERGQFISVVPYPR